MLPSVLVFHVMILYFVWLGMKISLKNVCNILYWSWTLRVNSLDHITRMQSMDRPKASTTVRRQEVKTLLLSNPTHTRTHALRLQCYRCKGKVHVCVSQILWHSLNAYTRFLTSSNFSLLHSHLLLNPILHVIKPNFQIGKHTKMLNVYRSNLPYDTFFPSRLCCFSSLSPVMLFSLPPVLSHKSFFVYHWQLPHLLHNRTDS